MLHGIYFHLNNRQMRPHCNELLGGCTTTLKDEASITPIREQAVSDKPPSLNKSVKLKCLCPLTTDAASQLDVLEHNSNTLGVNGTQVGIFEKTNKVCLRGFLEGKDSSGLETEVSLEILSNLPHKTLEGSL